MIVFIYSMAYNIRRAKRSRTRSTRFNPQVHIPTWSILTHKRSSVSQWSILSLARPTPGQPSSWSSLHLANEFLIKLLNVICNVCFPTFRCQSHRLDPNCSPRPTDDDAHATRDEEMYRNSLRGTNTTSPVVDRGRRGQWATAEALNDRINTWVLNIHTQLY